MSQLPSRSVAVSVRSIGERRQGPLSNVVMGFRRQSQGVRHTRRCRCRAWEEDPFKKALGLNWSESFCKDPTSEHGDEVREGVLRRGEPDKSCGLYVSRSQGTSS